MLNGKKALVTGGSRGIGRAITLALAGQGCDVFVLYASARADAEETCALARAAGVRAGNRACDVSDWASARQAAEAAVEAMGGLDILVNNAGIIRDSLLPAMKPEDFRAVVETSLFGAWNMTRAVSGHMIRRRAGRIINIASVAGLSASVGQSNYSAAKAGMIGMTRTVARELASRGVTCNAIAPGFIRTDMTRSLPEQRLKAALESIPMGRMGEPEDVANLAVFLAGDQAAYITGAVFTVDGGLSA